MQVHPSGRIIVLERECNWSKYLFEIEKQLHITGWIWFVIYAELFSGNFKLECVRSNNKYLQQGYLSTFFFKPEIPKNAKNQEKPCLLDTLEETLSEDEDPENDPSENFEKAASPKILGGMPNPFFTQLLDEGEQKLGVLNNFSAFRYENKHFRKLLPPSFKGLKGEKLHFELQDSSMLFVSQRGKSALSRDLTSLVTLAELAINS